MKAADLRGQDPAQLREQLTLLRKERFNLRFQRATGQLESTNRMREVRRDIARIMTVIGERERTRAAERATAARTPAAAGADAAANAAAE